MQTAWRHEDHESQREFERITKKTASAATEPAQVTLPGGAASAKAIVAPVKEYELNSPLNTIEVRTQKLGTKTTWDIERYLTTSVNDVEIPTRIDGVYKNNYRFDTVKHIKFKPGSNISIDGRYEEKDKVVVEIASTALPNNSLEGALSTVWVKDANGDIATGFGYNTGTGTYINQVVIGPWGWQDGAMSTTPYTASNYSNNAKDSQWDWGSSFRMNALNAYTRMGKVSKAGLYWVYGTTQGYRWVSSEFAASGTPFINIRVHYHCIVRRNGLAPKIYKSLDILPWDMWTWPSTSVEIDGRSLFIEKMSSLPWSVNGGCLIWLDPDDEVGHSISYFGGNGGETRFGYQVCYHAFEAVLVADSTTLDKTTQVNLTPINDGDVAESYHTMNFINV